MQNNQTKTIKAMELTQEQYKLYSLKQYKLYSLKQYKLYSLKQYAKFEPREPVFFKDEKRKTDINVVKRYNIFDMVYPFQIRKHFLWQEILK